METYVVRQYNSPDVFLLKNLEAVKYKGIKFYPDGSMEFGYMHQKKFGEEYSLNSNEPYMKVSKTGEVTFHDSEEKFWKQINENTVLRHYLYVINDYF